MLSIERFHNREIIFNFRYSRTRVPIEMLLQFNNEIAWPRITGAYIIQPVIQQAQLLAIFAASC